MTVTKFTQMKSNLVHEWIQKNVIMYCLHLKMVVSSMNVENDLMCSCWKVLHEFMIFYIILNSVTGGIQFGLFDVVVENVWHFFQLVSINSSVTEQCVTSMASLIFYYLYVFSMIKKSHIWEINKSSISLSKKSILFTMQAGTDWK